MTVSDFNVRYGKTPKFGRCLCKWSCLFFHCDKRYNIFIKDIITEVAGAQGAEDGVIVSWGTAFQSHEKKGSGADGGDGCTARRMHLHY